MRSFVQPRPTRLPRLGSSNCAKGVSRSCRWAEAAANLGFLLLRMQEPARARGLLSGAQRQGLDTIEVSFGLGQACSQLGRTQEAIEHYRAALNLSAGWHPVSNNLAWLLATRPDATRADAEEALALAKEPVSQGDRTADLLDTLAAAHAAVGDFEQASRVAQQAEATAEHDQNPRLAEEIRQRLAEYRAGRAYVDPSASPDR